ITGAVNHPGMYEYTAGLTLSQLLKKADSLREHAAANAILVKRREADNTRSLLSADWNAIREHVAKDIALLKEDSVYVPFVDSLQ
ncbi:SLBB domain-containing protein, partial [Pseudomonas sp. GW456-12-1-14-LB2]|uniref:SLBB domain-containing protein n=1 Tax=Pseudomonas sp. GW456-12-1-14-LB2 TaxID=2070606 RepID=UPI000CBB101B